MPSNRENGPAGVLTGAELLPGEWALETPEYMDYWLSSHRRFVERLGSAQHIVLQEVDHIEILRAPELREAILEMLRTVRAQRDAF